MSDKGPDPCPRVSEIEERLLVGGLGGGLSALSIECVLQEFSITHLVICGRREHDAHVQRVAEAVKNTDVTLHTVPLIPDDPSEVKGVLEAARNFVADAVEDELNCVLVACSKGASRSVAVVMAHLMAVRPCGFMEAFEAVAGKRWRIWPSSLLVNALLALEEEEEDPFREDADNSRRRAGSHAAWATAWHNGTAATREAAEKAWEDAVAEADGQALGQSDDVFALCKRKLLGLGAADLAVYTNGAGNTAECGAGTETLTEVNGVFLGGFGGLSTSDIAEVIKKHGVTHCVVCGRPGKDKHVDTTVQGASAAGLGAADLFTVPIADNEEADLKSHLADCLAFINKAKAGESRRVAIVCRQGASRSASVAMAHFMASFGKSAIEAFRSVAASRWRIWPNAGFVAQLLDHGETLTARRLSETERNAAFRFIGIHAAWAANRQNVEETGFGQKDLSLEAVEDFWEEARLSCISPGDCFEKCKALALGVDLTVFEANEPSTKKARTDV